MTGLRERVKRTSGGPGVMTLGFHFREVGLVPGRGTKIPHATQHGQKVK